MVYGIDKIITLYHDKYDILMPLDISHKQIIMTSLIN